MSEKAQRAMTPEAKTITPEPLAAAQTVQKLCCFNQGGFVMNFTVAYLDDATGETRTYGGSGDYPIGQYRVIDMSAAPGIVAGTWMWAKPTALAGDTIEAAVKVKFQVNENVSTYNVHGTTQSVQCDLIA